MSFACSFSLVGSCNGLVCIFSYLTWTNLVGNPLTREVRRLNLPSFLLDRSLCWGFGHDLSEDDYTVVVADKKGENQTCFYLLSLKSNVWRVIGEMKYRLLTCRVMSFACSFSCLASGLYYLAFDAFINEGRIRIMCQTHSDVVDQILVRLDVKDLIRFKRVCKSWHSLITSPRFINRHLNLSCNKDCCNNKLNKRRICLAYDRGVFLQSCWFLLLTKAGILCNGALHWLVGDNENTKKLIICYDLSKEEFKEIPLLPDDARYESSSHSYL
ncbi:putative F-box domain-containing protein [Helianthus anomalus]